MCGLLGMIARTTGGFLHADLQAFEQMLVINTVRGKDSVGCFTKYGNGDVRAIKHGSNPFNLMRSDEWKEFRQSVINRGKFLIGHNRAATMGHVNTDNAHPFVEDHIILVHNGTLRSQSNLTTKNTQVDSNAIAHALVEEDEDPRRVLDRIDGAFALIWYDSKKDKLYAARNEERPLVLIESPRHYVLSSETWIAAYPMSRNNLEVKEVTVIPPNVMYEFGRNGEHKTYEFENVKHSFTTSYYTHHGQSSVRRTASTSTTSTTTSTSPSNEKKDDSESFPEGSEATPEQKALRDQLAANARRKFNEEVRQPQGHWKRKRLQKLLTQEHLRDCANDPKSECGTAGPTAAASQGLTDEDKAKARQAHILVSMPEYPEGKVVLCKILQMITEPNGRARWTGTCMSPGMEMVDVCGFLPFGVKPSEYEQWYATLACAKIQWVTNTQNGGITLNVKETRQATYVKTHRADTPLIHWDHAMMQCKCSRCERKVVGWEVGFTSVKFKGAMGITKSGKPLNVIDVVCPDCIIKAMPKGDYLEDFKQKYHGAKAAIALHAKARADATGNGAVQDRQPVGSGTGGGDAKILQLPSPKTLQ